MVERIENRCSTKPTKKLNRKKKITRTRNSGQNSPDAPGFAPSSYPCSVFDFLPSSLLVCLGSISVGFLKMQASSTQSKGAKPPPKKNATAPKKWDHPEREKLTDFGHIPDEIPKELTDLVAPHINSFSHFCDEGVKRMIRHLDRVEVEASWRGRKVRSAWWISDIEIGRPPDFPAQVHSIFESNSIYRMQAI